MCGIAGIVGWDGSLDEKISVLRDMQHSLRRRGMDQEGIYTNGYASLIHTRLSVVDLENGRQPMEFSQGKEKYILTYNGELYNTKELREELESLGHCFSEYSDTEVLLHAYVQWKESCVERLNGIFAFAIWESHNHRLFFARDRIGVKPFFYTCKEGAFLFGSEIKAILAHPLIEAKIDFNSIMEIMLIGPGRTPEIGRAHV